MPKPAACAVGFGAALVLALAACMAPGSALPDRRSHSPPGEVRVVDERGRVATRSTAALGREVHRGADLLAYHLAQIEGEMREPMVLGNAARLLIDGPATHEAMFKAIDEARRYIHLETYILESGEPGERLAAALEAKRAEGVEVRLLYDGVGSLRTPPEYFKRLADAGVHVCEFNPVNPLKAEAGWHINNRDHRKLLVVDGRVGFTGGINISEVYSDGSFPSRMKEAPKRGEEEAPKRDEEEASKRDEGWRDTHVLVRGPVLAQFERLFADGWSRQRCGPPLDRPEHRRTAARAGDKAMRLMAADPGTGQSELYLALVSALAHARERAWLTYGYFVPDDRMLAAIQDAARRGVDVRLVLPGFSDFWAPFHAGRSHYTDLLKAGVRIFERRDALLHAKTAVIDGVWSTVGSTNLDWRSFVHNFEADLLVLDRDFAGEMENLFRLDQEASHEVGLAEWRRRDLGTRFKEWLARRWEYLL